MMRGRSTGCCQPLRQDEVVIVLNDDMPNSALSDIDARGRTDHNRAW